MPKQIKIGFDKTPSPIAETFPQLVDIEGNLLFDEAGNPLLTREDGTLSAFANARNSTSIFINNTKDFAAEIVPIEEQFAEQSAVSTNLLGYNRAEVQLSLFSDVSTYGYDVNNWNYYTFVERGTVPEWENKEHPVFGRRYTPTFDEVTNEQALILKSFPSEYSFPFGPAYQVDGNNTYNQDFFTQYLNFVALGKYLYYYFLNNSSDNSVFVNKNFITPRIKLFSDFEDETYIAEDLPFLGFAPWFNFPSDITRVDVDYGSDVQAGYDEIERFTTFWNKIRSGTDTYPDLVGQLETDFKETALYSDIRTLALTDSRAGYSTSLESFAILESKDTFRYQPGRASGFTFGVRAKTDPANLNNTLEWGCANDTDQYIFQLKSSQFNIIRRSTVSLPSSLITRLGLDPSDDNVVRTAFPVGLETSQGMQELVISRDFWNGDKLDGNGPSGYQLQFENVTMYKIEFSWYGAIGAKFYAYVPADNGNARWVLMHTLVIESGMSNPILKNPDFKFRYAIYSERTLSVREPFQLYKYGASYYIDGGDEGTLRQSSVTSDSKAFTTNTAVIGVMSKGNILSSFEGTTITNFKRGFPSRLIVSSDDDARIDIVEILGTAEGFHHHYTPSIQKGQIGETANLTFASSGTKIEYANGQSWDIADDEAKVIADGVYNVYVGYDSAAPTSADVLRKGNPDATFGFEFGKRPVGSRSLLTDDTAYAPRTAGAFSARLSKYDYAASAIPIFADRFKIHFLDPFARDGEFSSRHLADYFIGITPDVPEIDGISGELIFDDGTNPANTFNEDNFLLVESTAQSEILDINGNETSDSNKEFGKRFEIDPRLESDDIPKGSNSGLPSLMEVTVSVTNFAVESVTAGTGDFSGLFKVTFAEGVIPSIIEESLGRGEVGINGVGTGIFFAGPTDASDTKVYYGIESNRYYVYIDANPSPTYDIVSDGLQVKQIRVDSGFKLVTLDSDGNDRFEGLDWYYSKSFRFNSQPLYLIIGLKDNAKVNNIIVEEIFPDQSLTHTPNFIFEANSGISLSTVQGESSALVPSNFVSEQRLSGMRYDTQCNQPLRPGNVISSMYIGADENRSYDLSNIFAQDRINISRGTYNNRAFFFMASRLQGGGGNIEMTLTTQEQ